MNAVLDKNVVLINLKSFLKYLIRLQVDFQ